MNKKTKKEKDILFPIFQECILYLEGDFWKKFFDDISRGKKTKNILINNKTICTSTKRGGFTYDYTGKDAKLISEELKNILINIGICSDEDIKSNNSIKVASNEYLKLTEENEWKKVKNKKMKDQLITDFVISQKSKYKLNWECAKNLYSLIVNSFFVYKTHKSEDVVMNESKIEKIQDIVWNEQLNIFVNNRLNDENDYDINKNKKETNTLLNKYSKYIKSLTKTIINYSK